MKKIYCFFCCPAPLPAILPPAGCSSKRGGNFSAAFATSQLEATLGLSSFINLSAGLMLAFGLMFQIPLAVLTGIKFGLVSVDMLKNARPYIIVGILILAAIFTPPDIVSQLMLGVPTWLLFEAGVFAAGFLEKKS